MASAKSGDKKKSLATPGLSDPNTGATGSPTPPESSNHPSLGSSPTPSQAEAATQKAIAEASKAKGPPEAPKPTVPLRVFRQLSGVSPAEFRAFESYAAREEMRPCPVPEWRERFTNFKKMPTQKLKRFQPVR